MKCSAKALGLTLLLSGSLLPVMAQQAPAPNAANPAPNAAAPAKRAQRAVMGQVTAKGENTLDVQTYKRVGNGDQYKVTLTGDTRYARFQQAALGDLKEGNVVLVLGDRADNKITAQGIIRVALPDNAKPAEMRASMPLAMAGTRFLGKRAAALGNAQNQRRPLFGKVVSTQPLTVETFKHKNADAEKIEVTTSDATRVLSQDKAALADIQQGNNVLVMSKEAIEGTTVTAQSVVLLPARAANNRNGNARRQGKRNR